MSLDSMLGSLPCLSRCSHLCRRRSRASAWRTTGISYPVAHYMFLVFFFYFWSGLLAALWVILSASTYYFTQISNPDCPAASLGFNPINKPVPWPLRMCPLYLPRSDHSKQLFLVFHHNSVLLQSFALFWRHRLDARDFNHQALAGQMAHLVFLWGSRDFTILWK